MAMSVCDAGARCALEARLYATLLRQSDSGSHASAAMNVALDRHVLPFDKVRVFLPRLARCSRRNMSMRA